MHNKIAVDVFRDVVHIFRQGFLSLCTYREILQHTCKCNFIYGLSCTDFPAIHEGSTPVY